MKLTVVTGLSGAGKTEVLKYLEDNDFFCVDNLPPVLIPQLAELFFSAKGEFAKIALGIDARVGEMINELMSNLEALRKSGYQYTLLFVDADDDVLIKRYKETRHSHPIDSDEGLLGSIKFERKVLEKLYNEADYVINTSHLEIYELHKELRKICMGDNNEGTIKVNIIPFGFKYGLPLDSDLVFDVRCFPNPFYIPELKNKTGNDKEVYDYVMSFSETEKFYLKMLDMISDLLPLYYDEGKETITISIGCTGGKHRSVSIANRLGNDLKNKKYEVNMIYRDISRGK